MVHRHALAVVLGLSACIAACTDDKPTSESGAGGGGPGGGGSGGQGAGGGGASYEDAVKAASWVVLDSAPTVGGGAKQDDMFWLDAERGFLASGPSQSLFATTDGGQSWTTVFESSGTYFRALLFTDDQHGFAGNLGAGLTPAISDENVIYQTADGGSSWTPVAAIGGAAPEGICNFTASDADHLFGVGRANGPSHLVHSSDGGASWTGTDLSAWLMMAIDVHFESPEVGLVAGMGTSGRCTILRTTDGGASFEAVFESTTPASLCWKLHFPSDQVGYVAVQDTGSGPGTFGKTSDGGTSWEELPLPVTDAYAAIGVGFITEDIGWMAPDSPAQPVFRTFDGGLSWEEEPVLKGPINRFRFVDSTTAYAVGATVYKLEIAYDGP